MIKICNIVTCITTKICAHAILIFTLGNKNSGFSRITGKIMSTKMRHFRSSSDNNTPKEDDVEVVRFDMERLKVALSGGSIKAPVGLSREEKAKFIIKYSK